MDILSAATREATRKKFEAELRGPVRLVHFTKGPSGPIFPGPFGGRDCAYCRETRRLLEEVAALSAKLALEVHDVQAAPEAAAAWGIDKVPGLAVCGEEDDGIRFFGIPTGYEYTSLIEAIVDVSNRRTSLSAPVREALRALARPVHLQVFVTPTCPHCSAAVRMAHRFALESRLVRADMIESNEFPELSDRYRVLAVPKTVINGAVEFEGVPTEDELLRRLSSAIAPPP